MNLDTLRMVLETAREITEKITSAALRHHINAHLDAIDTELRNWGENGFIEVPIVDQKELECS